MLAPLPDRRRSPDRRSAAEPDRSIVVPSVATSPAIAKVIARRWSSRLSVVAPRSAAPPRITRSSPSTLMSAPSAARPAATPAIRSDSLWRSSPAPRIVVVPCARVAARHRTGISSMAAATSAGPRSMARSAEERTTRSATGSPTIADPRRASGRPLLDVRAHRAEDVDDRAARRVDTDVAQGQLGVGMDGRRRRARTPPPTRRPARADRSPAPPSLLPPPRRRPSSLAARSTGTPRARSMRSVWSRVPTRSRTVVRPSARRPASRMADFTCADGTGVV